MTMPSITNSMWELFGSYIANHIINCAVIASGGGTTANIFMIGARDGWIPGIEIKILICTKAGEKCIDKAIACGVPWVLVNRKDYLTQDEFNDEIAKVLKKYGVELAFTAGCNQRMRACPGVYFSNNHPAPTDSDGGTGMYDIMVHEHVIKRIADKISRHPYLINEEHRTRIDHHEVFPRDPSKKGMDEGDLLATTWVDIPPYIITGFMDGSFTLREAAELLQQHVMKYEYMSIISNAIIDAQRVRDAKKARD